MLRCHVRYRTLAIVLSELYRYRRDMGIDVRVCALMDRCCPDVQELLEDYSRAPWFFTIDAPRRSLDKDGEHFMELLNVQMDAMEERWPDLEWIYAQDDDRWFEPVHITEELPRALADDSKDVQSIYAPPALLKFPRDFAPDYGEWKDLWKERWE
jgi:hypothetical protein